MKKILEPEDYLEPACLLCMDETAYRRGSSIPLGRVFGKLDEHLNKKDFEGALRHLNYWLGEAKREKDDGGRLSVLNELMGLYRREGLYSQALEKAEEAELLLINGEFEELAVAGTTYLNIATVMKAAGQAEKAFDFYVKAEKNYLLHIPLTDKRFGGLYNNMALALVDLCRYEEALVDYNKALKVMEKEEHGCLECAVTYLNMANLYEAQMGFEKAEKRITECVFTAKELLDTKDLPQNGYTAFVYEKCAPTFGYYGYFLWEEELRERAGKIYERA